MATDRRTLPSYQTDDTAFRAWAAGIHAQIIAMGLVQTTDTGQVDLSTVTKPTVANTFAGYRVYRFADSLQATKPVFIKLEWGVAAAVTTPNMRLQVGVATNGAGTISGNNTSQITVTPVSAPSAGQTRESFCSGSTSALRLIANFDPALNGHGMIVFAERTVDPDGTPNGSGVVVHAGGITSTFSVFQLLPFTGGVPGFVSGNTQGPWNINDIWQTNDGANVALHPLAVMVAGKTSLVTWLRYRHTDISELTPISVSHLGSARTFMPMGDGVSGVQFTGIATFDLALPWE